MTLAELRNAAGLKQVDVARKMNLDQSTVSSWEIGKNKPLAKNRKRLAKLYCVSVDELNMAIDGN